MAIKLGELLLNEKLVTPGQLDEALRNQAIFGIKLGSSLIELGFIDDQQLCRFLSRKLGVPAVAERDLSWISGDVLALVPAEVAARLQVVPFRLDGKKLSLAMADPADFKAIDEVAFVTSCIVIPHIVPEVRIISALTKYYQTGADSRYQRIEMELANKRRASHGEGKKTEKSQTVTFSVPGKNGELLKIEIPKEFEGFASLPDYGDEYGAAGGVERYTVDRLSLEFASAKNREQIAAVFIKYLGQEFRIGALFVIRNGMAVGWRGIASGRRIEDLESLAISLDRPSVMKNIYEARQFSMGPLDKTPENSLLLATLGVDAGTPLLVLPIIMLNNVVAAVVVSSDMDALGRRLQELQKLVYKTSLAFEMLIIKNKILMT